MTSPADQFLTLDAPAEGYFMDRGSKFLAFAFPVTTEDEASLFLQAVKKDHPKARHYCTALRLYPDASLERFSDDGEPAGSAGRPILGQLIRFELTHVLVVVVRYFGGTKLGIPGLIEAYKTSTSLALEASTIVQRHVYGRVLIHMAYDSYPQFLNHCKHHSIPVFQESFSDHAELIIGFKKSTVKEELIRSLQVFSQMDFKFLDQYAEHLGMKIEIRHETEIM